PVSRDRPQGVPVTWGEEFWVANRCLVRTCWCGVALSGLPVDHARRGLSAPSDRTGLNVRSLRPDRASGGAGGAAVWLDAVLAEQAAQAIELAVQLLAFRDDGLTTGAQCQLLLQPQLAGVQ